MNFIKIEDFLNSKTNFHTHSVYCDGKDTLEEMVDAALAKNFKTLGFSGHCMFPSEDETQIQLDEIDEYCAKIRLLKEKNAGKIRLLLGFEGEYVPGISEPTFENYKQFNPDYLIGSVHYLLTEKGIMIVDGSKDEVSEALKNVFGGDGKKAVCEYFNAQREMLRLRTNEKDFQILGHPDLIRKQNANLNFFDETESWYKSELDETVKEIKRAEVIVEINTGSIARGYMKTPYPTMDFLQRLKENNIPVTINSDCHNKDFIDFYFPQALELAQKAGYKEIAVL